MLSDGQNNGRKSRLTLRATWLEAVLMVCALMAKRKAKEAVRVLLPWPNQGCKLKAQAYWWSWTMKQHPGIHEHMAIITVTENNSKNEMLSSLNFSLDWQRKGSEMGRFFAFNIPPTQTSDLCHPSCPASPEALR